jgi:hypothetical protein
LSNIVSEILKTRLLDVGEVRVSRATPSGVQGRPRFFIHLPMSRNYLWHFLNEAGVKVRVYIELPKELLEKVRATIQPQA